MIISALEASVLVKHSLDRNSIFKGHMLILYQPCWKSVIFIVTAPDMDSSVIEWA